MATGNKEQRQKSPNGSKDLRGSSKQNIFNFTDEKQTASSEHLSPFEYVGMQNTSQLIHSYRGWKIGHVINSHHVLW